MTPGLVRPSAHRACFLLAAWGLALSAWAHEQQGQAAGFIAGLLHPVSDLDRALAMVAVGMRGAQLGAPAIWVLPIAFPLVMAMGRSASWACRCRASSLGLPSRPSCSARW